jgi:hypothetical protein
MIHNFADRSKHRSLLIPTPRMGTLSDWSFRRGGPLRSPIKIFFGGAPRLSNQSNRVSILGVRISSQLQTFFSPILHFSPPPSHYFLPLRLCIGSYGLTLHCLVMLGSWEPAHYRNMYIGGTCASRASDFAIPSAPRELRYRLKIHSILFTSPMQLIDPPSHSQIL